METLHDAEGLLAMWVGAVNQLKDHFAVLEAAGEDEGNKAYISYVACLMLASWSHTRVMTTLRLFSNF